VIRKVVAMFSMACLLASCAHHEAGKPGVLADETFLDVARRPQAFEGQTVTMRAWITLRHEDKNLWATWTDHQSWNTERCVSLINYDSLENFEQALDGHFVEVVGTVVSDASREGTLLRFASCRDVAIEISGPSAIRPVIR